MVYLKNNIAQIALFLEAHICNLFVKHHKSQENDWLSDSEIFDSKVVFLNFKGI